jgi:hypothetical protein
MAEYHNETLTHTQKLVYNTLGTQKKSYKRFGAISIDIFRPWLIPIGINILTSLLFRRHLPM